MIKGGTINKTDPVLTPVKGTNSRLNDGRLIGVLDYQVLEGGIDIVHEIHQLPLGGFSEIVNLRPLRPGFVKRKGCAKLNTTADGVNKVMTLFGFSKGKQSQIKFYVQMSDGDVLQAANNPPTVGTTFGSSVYNTTGTMLPASWAVIDDHLLYADGTGYPRIFSGENERVSNFIVYKGAAAIPDIPKMGEDYSIDVADDDQTTHAILDSLGTLAQYDCVFIRTETPADTLTWTITKPNGSAAAAQMHYWNGAWTGVTSFTDNTASGGATLATTGATMTWTMPADHQPKYMFGANGYWYRLSLDSGALDSEVEVSEVTYNSDWMEIQSLWDGVPVASIEAYVYINSTATYQYYASDVVEIGGLTSSDKFYFNSVDPISGFYASVGEVPNATAATTIAVKYWNGTEFAALTANDSTIVDSKSFASDGWVTVNHPTDEQPTMFQSSNQFTYWYEVSFSQTLTADMVVSIETMPYFNLNSMGKCYALSSFKQRAAYSFEKAPGYIMISNAYNPMVINGEDSALQDVGDGRANRVICIKKFYNELLVWQEEKGKDGGCLTLIEGYSPATFGKRVLSTVLGTFSAKSAVVIEDVPNVDPNEKVVRRAVAIFLSRYGAFMTDGKNIVCISTDIQDYFDSRESVCIRRGYESEHWIDYDSLYNVVRMGIVSGASATVPNVFLVYDVKTGKWSTDTLTQPFSCHAEVEAASGQFTVLQVAGGTADGTIYRTNYGATDVSTAFTGSLTMEYDGQGHDLFLDEIVVRVNGACTLTPYADTIAKDAITIST
jgi:hypothetical protein